MVEGSAWFFKRLPLRLERQEMHQRCLSFIHPAVAALWVRLPDLIHLQEVLLFDIEQIPVSRNELDYFR